MPTSHPSHGGTTVTGVGSGGGGLRPDRGRHLCAVAWHDAATDPEPCPFVQASSTRGRRVKSSVGSARRIRDEVSWMTRARGCTGALPSERDCLSWLGLRWLPNCGSGSKTWSMSRPRATDASRAVVLPVPTHWGRSTLLERFAKDVDEGFDPRTVVCVFAARRAGDLALQGAWLPAAVRAATTESSVLRLLGVDTPRGAFGRSLTLADTAGLLGGRVGSLGALVVSLGIDAWASSDSGAASRVFAEVRRSGTASRWLLGSPCAGSRRRRRRRSA